MFKKKNKQKSTKKNHGFIFQKFKNIKLFKKEEKTTYCVRTTHYFYKSY